MFVCEICGKEFEEDWRCDWSKKYGGIPRFCSKECAHKRKSLMTSSIPVESKKLDLHCKYCKKECKNLNSLRQHEVRCKENPNRIITCFSNSNWQLEYNKTHERLNQYTKARKEGREYILSEEAHKHLRDAKRRRDIEFKKSGRNKEIAKKISETVNKKVKEGTWHTSQAKISRYNYKGLEFLSSWEVLYAQYLDANNIKWVQNTETFPYIYKEKEHRYLPDFYLIDTNEYVEIKGRTRDRDKAKWSQFPRERKLTILKQKDLEKLLGIKLNNKIIPKE